ncbi:MAG: hypothetical protein LUD17_07255 [Bacteroidales bacterium]|nr:hypothetical protein [Bacteroidales bacterium]
MKDLVVRYFLLLKSCLYCMLCFAQQLTVKSVELTMDVLTVDKIRKGLNGTPCALVNV